MEDHELLTEIEEAIECGWEPNDWEQEFIESIAKRIGDDRGLTAAQREKLEQIHAQALESDD